MIIFIFIILENTSKSKSTKLCNSCYAVIGKGKSHKCGSQTLVQNLSNLMLEIPEKPQTQVVSKVLKIKVKENFKGNEESSPVLKLSQMHGRPLPITIGITNTSLSKNESLSTDNLLAMKTDMNLSDRDTLKLAASIRAGTKNRKAVEPGLKKKLTTKAHSIDEYFSYKEFPLVKVKGDEVSNTPLVVVYCNDVPGFVEYVRQERNLSEDHLKLGIDGGGGFLKICLSVQSKSNMEFESANKKRAKYIEGIIYFYTVRNSTRFKVLYMTM